MKYLFILFIFTLFLSLIANAQSSGWLENKYYSEQGKSDIICGTSYPVFVGYDFYGRPMYKRYQNCQQRNWHSWYGRRGGYFWTCNAYSCYWDFRYEERTWWYFTWYNFTREC